MGDRIKTWGGIGSFWGAIWGLLPGPVIFYIPPVGLIAAAGPFVMALVGALEGAAVVGGVSAIGAALVSLGVSKDRAIKYEGEIQVDRFVVIVQGTADDIERARAYWRPRRIPRLKGAWPKQQGGGWWPQSGSPTGPEARALTRARIPAGPRIPATGLRFDCVLWSPGP